MASFASYILPESWNSTIFSRSVSGSCDDFAFRVVKTARARAPQDRSTTVAEAGVVSFVEVRIRAPLDRIKHFEDQSNLEFIGFSRTLFQFVRIAATHFLSAS